MTSSFRLAIWFGPRWEHTHGGLAWFHVIHSLMFIPKSIQEVREKGHCQNTSGVSGCFCTKRKSHLSISFVGWSLLVRVLNRAITVMHKNSAFKITSTKEPMQTRCEHFSEVSMFMRRHLVSLRTSSVGRVHLSSHPELL